MHLRILLAGAWLCVQLSTAFAGDWPQILGPGRDGIATEERIPTELSADWQASWKVNVGTGYAGPAVVGGRVILFHRVGANERIEAFAAETGKSLWKAEFPALYRGGIDPDHGPRCVPLVHEDVVLAYGAAGDLHCVSLTTGKPLWTRTLLADARGDEGYFGAGSTPIVLEQRVLVNVGGKGSGIVGLDLKTGKTVWQQTDENASYSAPTYWQRAGKKDAIFITRLNAIAVTSNGEVTKLRPFGARGPTVNGATPLVVGEQLFFTASYGIGAACGKLSGADWKSDWENDDTLSSQYPTPVHHAGILYGIHGREDAAGAELRGIELATGKIRWSVPDFGVANLILADGKLLILKTKGEFILAEATPQAFRPLGKASLAKETSRALPALSNGTLYFRTTTASGGELQAWKFGKR